MTAMTEERPIFENEEWLVMEGGLEHKKTGYFIERESMGQRREDGLWTWPLHMAEKSWCAMQPFAEAFSCAASVYDMKTGPDLAQTFKVARSEISAWPHTQNQAQNPAPLMLETLRTGGRNPIYMELGSTEKSLNDADFQNPGESWRIRTQSGARPFLKTTRIRSTRLGMERASPLSWRAPRRIRKTGTKLVRLLQAAWNIR